MDRMTTHQSAFDPTRRLQIVGSESWRRKLDDEDMLRAAAADAFAEEEHQRRQAHRRLVAICDTVGFVIVSTALVSLFAWMCAAQW